MHHNRRMMLMNKRKLLWEGAASPRAEMALQAIKKAAEAALFSRSSRSGGSTFGTRTAAFEHALEPFQRRGQLFFLFQIAQLEVVVLLTQLQQFPLQSGDRLLLCTVLLQQIIQQTFQLCKRGFQHLEPPAKSRRAYSKARPATSGGPLPAASGRAVEPEEQLDYTPDVLLELPLVHGRRESDEQPEMGVALEQGEEVTRRVHRLVDAQLSPGAGLLQNQVHALAYPLRTCLIEQLGQLGILPGHPYQQPVQGQRLGAVDQRAE